MDKKEAKEFSNDAVYGLNEMVTLISDQTEEIDYLKDTLVNNLNTTSSLKDKITSLKGEIEDLSEYPDCPTEDIEFDGEDDFCK